MKSKGSIDTYNTIYPIDFIVASNSIKLVDLQKLLQYSDKTELDDDILQGNATTSKCFNKKTKKYCILVKCNITKDKSTSLPFLVDVAAHEAIHVCCDTYQYIESDIPVKYTLQEPFAYFCGYVTKCVFNTMCKK